MKAYRNIVVGTDFSEGSKAAVEEAIRLGARDDASIRVLHVIRKESIDEVTKTLGISTDTLARTTETRLKELVEELAPGVGNVSAETLVGHPVKDLEEAQEGADLLIMGTSGSGGSLRATGMTATQCVRRATTDVLLVRESHRTGFKRVTACLGLGGFDENTIQTSISICRRENAPLELLHVYFPPWERPGVKEHPLQRDPVFHHEFRTGIQQKLDKVMFQATKDLPDTRIDTCALDSLSHPSGILKRLNYNDSDLVVIGRRGESPMEDLILGSVAERVIRESPCSVYVAK